MDNAGLTLDVIQISSSGDDLSSSEDFNFMDVDIDGDEVNSPADLPKPIASRKLFVDEDVPPIDRESTTESSLFFVDVGPGGNLRSRYERSHPKQSNPNDNIAMGPPTHVFFCKLLCIKLARRAVAPYSKVLNIYVANLKA
ncbi:hypothetical protein SASPL_133965 [Salvia splendens]|uniref:Uncharacterized protein n=1 Tax=Salvia splendens TaxID=180675 RepID=A0A8X8X2A5_SALSN|nr:hypothetical protein SASPL_133965 [Salvia splendens]